ncbi:hypothetical protein ACOSQ2_005213 [Xanthoceras sorbifolium]
MIKIQLKINPRTHNSTIHTKHNHTKNNYNSQDKKRKKKKKRETNLSNQRKKSRTSHQTWHRKQKKPRHDLGSAHPLRSSRCPYGHSHHSSPSLHYDDQHMVGVDLRWRDERRRAMDWRRKAM